MPQNIYCEKAVGNKFWDIDGNEYLDFFGGILVTMSGYKVPGVVQAIKDQADRMLHTSTLYLIEQQIEIQIVGRFHR